MRWVLAAFSFAAGAMFAPCAIAGDLSHANMPAASDLAEPTSQDTARIVAWVIATDDNAGLPFLVIDKINAQARAFDGDGILIGAAAVLLGVARGDISPPGIGVRPLARIGPEDRITPAGRFVASRGENLGGHDILWVDYDAAISLHPVIVGAPADRRYHRLESTTAQDNRISFGCINVPIAFYEQVVRPLFSATTGIVYILPETRSLEDVFALTAFERDYAAARPFPP